MLAPMSLDEEAKRGAEARQLMENKVFQDAMQAVESSIINSMRRVPVGDDKMKDALILSLQLLEQIQKKIKEYSDTGKMAEISLQKDGPLRKLRRVAGL